MRSITALPALIVLLHYTPSFAGNFSGEFKLVPEGCQNAPERICRLQGRISYRSDNGLVWQTAEWKDENGKSGTTDGASIPTWAQPIIGDQYDSSYLKAAIIHDHYCYKENWVRTWQETHRMFYDALVDLGIDKTKAKVMYFAVYWKGPRWTWEEMSQGESCGLNCIQRMLHSSIAFKNDEYDTEDFDEKIKEIILKVETNPNITIDSLEKIANELNSNTSPARSNYNLTNRDFDRYGNAKR